MTKKIFTIAILILVFTASAGIAYASTSTDENLTLNGTFRFSTSPTAGYVLTSTDGLGNASWAAAATGTVTSVSGGTTGLTVSNPTTTPTLAGTLVVSNGGTGLTAITANNLIYGNGTSAASLLAPGATTGMFLRNTAAGAPSWSTLVLPNAATTGDVLYASAANTLTVRTIGTAGQVLTVAGGLPTWAAPVAVAHTLTDTNNTVSGLTAGQILRATGATTYGFSTATYPNTATTGDVLYASAANTISNLADVATGNALISGGVGVAPSWAKIGLTTHVSGTLPVGNGGTGLATTPTNGQLLIGNGTNYTLAGLTGTANQITVTPGAGSITLSIPASPTFTGLTLSGLGLGIVHSSAGGLLSSSAVGLASADVTGTLPIANGGTNGTATPTNGGVAYGTGTVYAFTAAGTVGQVLSSNGAAAPTWVFKNPTASAVTDNTITSPTPGTCPTYGTEIEILTPTWASITPDNTSQRILINGGVDYSNPTGGDDTNAQIRVRVRRGSGNCTGTQVGPDFLGGASDPLYNIWVPFSLIDSPATASAQAYTICAALCDTNGAGGTNATTPAVFMTLTEVGP